MKFYNAAHAARCAGEQDALRGHLYENQSDWNGLSDPTEAFTGYAVGQELGVQGTPTLIVNGVFFVGSQPYSEVTDLIDSIFYN